MATRTLPANRYAELDNLIQTWENRLRVKRVVFWLPYSLAPGLVIAILIAFMSRARPWLQPDEILLATLALAALGVLAMLLLLRFRSRDGLESARHFDLEFGLQERVSTALELKTGNIRAPDELREYQLEDAWEKALQVQVDESIKLVFRWRAWVNVAVLIVILAILLVLPNPQADAASRMAQQAAAIEGAIEEIRDAAELVAADTSLEEGDREELLELLEESLETLQAEGITPDEAFAVTSEAESRLQEQSDELNERLQERLEALREAAEALGAEEDMAERLSEMMENAENMSEQERQDAAAALEEAATAMEQISPELAESLQQSAEALQQGNPEMSQEAMQEFLENLEQFLSEQDEMSEASEAMQEAAAEVQESAEQIAESGEEEGQQSEEGQQGDTEMSESDQGVPVMSESESEQMGDDSQMQRSQDAAAGDSSADQGEEEPGPSASEVEQNNSPSGEGEGEYEPIYAPEFVEPEEGGEVIVLETDNEDVPLIEGEYSDNPFGNTGVPYNQVFSDYSDAANRALDSDYVPLGLRDVVRQYFTSLEPE